MNVFYFIGFRACHKILASMKTIPVTAPAPAPVPDPDPDPDPEDNE
jgi:hypothetical protein